MKTLPRAILPLSIMAALSMGSSLAHAEEMLKPYVLASASKAVTEVAGQPQTSYTNPEYMKNSYRMKGDVSSITSTLEKALGKQKTFGSAEGISAADLREYHYMMAMPYFDDQIELANYDSHASAVQKVEAGLNSGKGVKKVYRIDIPGKEEVVFGVGISEGEGADKAIMGAIDTGSLRQSAHLPYEVLVSGNKAYILHGKFRIAQSFPDLGMGSFMTISAAPDAIENSLTKKAAPSSSLLRSTAQISGWP